jgi:F0F1-type ATP synthase membrane subunit b/b'
MKIWNKIKSSLLWIGIGIVGILGLIATFGKLFTRRSTDKLQDKIEDNEKKIERVKGKEDQLKTQKRQVKKELTELKETVKKTKATKTAKRRPGRPKKTTSQAKHNIVSKTKRKR